MKALMILGSRNPEGRTATAAKALLEGVIEGGSQAEEAFLPQRKIERCRQCEMDGWGTCRTEGRCAIEDDFASLVDGIKSADAVVFATPVYFGDLSESMRAFLERLRRVTRHSAAKEDLVGKPAIGICVAGGGGGGAPNCTVSLERVLRTCGFDVVDMVPARHQNLDHKVEILNTTGRWLATGPTS